MIFDIYRPDEKHTLVKGKESLYKACCEIEVRWLSAVITAPDAPVSVILRTLDKLDYTVSVSVG